MTRLPPGRFHPAVLNGDRRVDDTAWQHALDTLAHVGTCGRCGNPLRPLPAYRVGAVAWYPAQCTADGCDYETTAHGPSPEKKG